MTEKKDKLIKEAESASQGDAKAFVRLCEMIVKDVLYICKREFFNEQDAMDAAQEVFIRLQKDIRGLKDPSAFRAWLTRLTINTCRRMGQKNMNERYHTPLDDVDESELEGTLDFLPQSYVEDRELNGRVIEAIDRLSDDYRRVILLFYFQRMSYAEIAESLEMSYDAVNKKLDRARKLLKVELEDERKTRAWSIAPIVPFGIAMRQIFKNEAAAIPTATAKTCLESAGVKGAFSATGFLTAAGTAGGAGYVITMGLKLLTIITALSVGGAAITYVARETISPTVPPATHAPAEEDQLPQDWIDEEPGAQWGDDEEPVQIEAHALSGRVLIESSGVIDENVRLGLPGVTVELVDAETGAVVESTETLSDIENGLFYLYTFEPGEYKIRVLLPEGAQLASAGKYGFTPDAEDARVVWLEKDGTGIFTLTENEPQVIDNLELVLKYQSTISGRVGVMVGNAEVQSLLPTTTVALLDPQGRAVMQTAVDGNGGYVFKNPAVSQTGTYTLRFSVDSQVGLQVPFDHIAIPLAPGESKVIPEHTMSDTSGPLITVTLSGRDCECGHINPSGVEITTTDVSGINVSWTLFIDSSGAEVVSGTSGADLNTAIQALESNNYKLVVTATDTSGNSTQVTQLITIID